MLTTTACLTVGLVSQGITEYLVTLCERSCDSEH